MATPVMKPYFRRRKSRLQKSARTALVIALLYAIVFSQLDWIIPRSKSQPWLEPTLPWSLVVDDMSTTLILNSLTVYLLIVLLFGVLPELVGHKKQRVGPPAQSSIPPPPPRPAVAVEPRGAAPGTAVANGESSAKPASSTVAVIELPEGGSPSDALPYAEGGLSTNGSSAEHRARIARAA